ncbi:PucR family transcriptional regulator [Mycolicibacterium bacteremicum]|uniref:CdaR GGDEF-like domain-containing protein n=1 Tax=Mycolicibacterium bacteremicum TaxID=564198 RepID=A0A1W9YZL5_MYCBA|nr:PucR family transcriptional regulator [Mycolicibacterium bacteremicum]ORA05362.1 hypothetical protein BST17_09135 [Mycolicibacterium bacteremicum]
MEYNRESGGTAVTAPSVSGSITSELAALSGLSFDVADVSVILHDAAAAVPRVGPCQVEAAYELVDSSWDRVPPGPAGGTGLDQLVADCHGDGEVRIAGRMWGRALPLKHHNVVEGALVVSAGSRPSSEQIQMLAVLANQAGAALSSLALHRRVEQLDQAAARLADVNRQLHRRALVHQTIETAALSKGSGDAEQSIIDALHELTALPIALEDRFGNLRCWSGPGRPRTYPPPDPQRHQRQLAVLAGQHGPVRLRDRLAELVSPRGEQLGVLAMIDPRNLVTDDDMYAMHFACALLGYQLSHERSLVELEASVRRGLVDDLLSGTDDAGAVARADALGYDLRHPHQVIVVHSEAGVDILTPAVTRAAATLQLRMLSGRKGDVVVLVTAGGCDPAELHRVLSQMLSPATCAIGVGSQCDVPAHGPRSFTEAQRALNVRMHSAAPDGASAYAELGFYRLIDAFHVSWVCVADVCTARSPSAALSATIDAMTSRTLVLATVSSHCLRRTERRPAAASTGSSDSEGLVAASAMGVPLDGRTSETLGLETSVPPTLPAASATDESYFSDLSRQNAAVSRSASTALFRIQP